MRNFSLDGMAQTADGANRLFMASMGVIEGAFRFTTSLFYKFRGKREVDVHFATVTAGVRGTDLWGKSSSERRRCTHRGQDHIVPGGTGTHYDAGTQVRITGLLSETNGSRMAIRLKTDLGLEHVAVSLQ